MFNNGSKASIVPQATVANATAAAAAAVAVAVAVAAMLQLASI